MAGFWYGLTFSVLYLTNSVILIQGTGNGGMHDPQYSGNGETPLFWNKQAKDNLRIALSSKFNIGIAKNVILFVGDGMGISTVTAARIFQGQQRNQTGEENILSFEKFPYLALSKVYGQDHQTPDSACTSTAMLCGVKSNRRTLALKANVQRYDCEGSKGEELSSIFDWSKDKGKSTGIVTTTRITHATPAAGYSHSAFRDWESDVDMTNVTGGCKDIAKQLIEDNPDIQVLLGGGRRAFLPFDAEDPEGYNLTKYGRRDNRSLIQEWINDKEERNKNHRYVWNSTEFYKVNAANTDYLLGLFEGSHMQFEADRLTSKEKAGEPSLAEMTTKALEILRKNNKGYFLLVEGGRIDHAHHMNLAQKSLVDTLAFADAVAAADELTSEKDTLIVVTADHSHVFVISGYPTRGNPILGLTDNYGATRMADDGIPYTTLMYANGPGAPINDTRSNLTGVKTDDKEFVFQSAVPLSRETHGGEDVAIYARGPMSHLFEGVKEQNYIAHVMAYASCVGDYKNHADCAASLTVRQPSCPPSSGYRHYLSIFLLLLCIYSVKCLFVTR